MWRVEVGPRWLAAPGATRVQNRRWQSPECCQRARMNRGDLFLSRCALPERGVPREWPSTITNGQKLVLMFRLPQIIFSDVDFGQKRQLARKQPSLAKTVAGTKNGTVSRGEKARIQSLLPPRTETLEGRNPCARAARIYIRTGEKSVRTRRLDRSGGGGLQVAPTKGLDPNLPRGFCRSASTRIRPIAGGRIANVVSKFRWALLSFSVTAGRREIQRESPPNLTNGQEAGKTFQRKMFHVLTVFFCRLVRRFLLDPVIRAIGFSASATF